MSIKVEIPRTIFIDLIAANEEIAIVNSEIIIENPDCLLVAYKHKKFKKYLDSLGNEHFNAFYLNQDREMNNDEFEIVSDVYKLNSDIVARTEFVISCIASGFYQIGYVRKLIKMGTDVSLMIPLILNNKTKRYRSLMNPFGTDTRLSEINIFDVICSKVDVDTLEYFIKYHPDYKNCLHSASLTYIHCMKNEKNSSDIIQFMLDNKISPSQDKYYNILLIKLSEEKPKFFKDFIPYAAKYLSNNSKQSLFNFIVYELFSTTSKLENYDIEQVIKYTKFNSYDITFEKFKEIKKHCSEKFLTYVLNHSSIGTDNDYVY